MDDVWACDAVARAAIRRNRVAHPACVPVSVAGGPADRVGLVLDDGTMAAHAPPPREAWEQAEAAGALSRSPGSLSTFGAAASANERPERIAAAAEFLRASGLVARCVAIDGRPATAEELQRVHSAEHVQAMLGCRRPAEPWRVLRVSSAFNTVFMNQHSVDAALHATGGAIEAVGAVLRGDVASALCVVRPPGHHCERGCPMGFCLFNSVAAAAAHALSEGLERVLIVDWDIHHGNGTQEVFAADRRVLHFSVHGLFAFPAFAREGQMGKQEPGYVGEPGAEGYTANCAWTSLGHGDAEYEELWARLLLPMAREFDPELVLVCAGFDSAAGDEEGYSVTPAGYARLLGLLRPLAGGRLVVVLEGGYNIPAVSRGLHACLAALLGVAQVPPPPPSAPVDASAADDIQAARRALRPHWRALAAAEGERPDWVAGAPGCVRAS